MHPFLDIRNHGFARIAVAIPRVHLGNPAANAEEHRLLLEQAAAAGAQYVLCPELGLTGYSNGDLFHSQVLHQGALNALKKLVGESYHWGMLVSVGMPLVVDDALYNVAVTFGYGRIWAVAPKAYPPEYREFYELRHFARAAEARSTSIVFLSEEVPFGTNILIRHSGIPNFVLHTEICEDLWVPIPPSTEAALAGATVLANLSASNITIGKSEYREQLVVQSSARNLAVQLYSAAGFGESTTDLAWDGDALIAERGILLTRNKRFSMEGSLIVQDVDLPLLVQDRIRQSSFHQNAADHRMDVRWVTSQSRNSLAKEDVFTTLLRSVDAHPFVPSDPLRRDDRCRETFMIQATSLARRLQVLPEKRRKVVVAISGGQDSTHALMVAVHAMDLLGLPRTNIIALTMDGFGTVDRTHDNAVNLAQAVGAVLKQMPITDFALRLFEAIGHDPSVEDVTFENSQAWIRKILELATGAQDGGIVLGTGDLSELMIGWCTMFGDHASHYGVNAGVPKTLISFLIRWTAEVLYKEDEAIHTILLDILATPISPQLTSAREGKIIQKTEEIVGPYELIDFFGYWTVRFGLAPSRIVRMALHAFEGKYTVAEVKKWLGIFLTRFFASQFKRSCLPDGPKVGLTCISPRGDWRMPSDADPAAWVADLAAVPDVLS